MTGANSQPFAALLSVGEFCEQMTEAELEFAGYLFTANSMRSLFFPSENTLLLADCHFGKATHFRRHQIPIPQNAALADYQQLYFTLNHYKPTVCIFLGDLFHSAGNNEWLWLTALRKEFEHIQFQLVLGNHDILPREKYLSSGFEVYESVLLGDRIHLLHEPPQNFDAPVICGHMHPGFTLRGKARQAVSMPCFYRTQNLLILPAFGKLTGFINMDKHLPGGDALCMTGEKLVWCKSTPT